MTEGQLGDKLRQDPRKVNKISMTHKIILTYRA